MWEPILPTDWSKPSTSALRRLDDPRVRQFWDRNHMVAGALKTAAASSSIHPNCCERNGFLWDLFAAYGPGAMWQDTMPQPILFNGAVAPEIAGLDSLIAKAN